MRSIQLVSLFAGLAAALPAQWAQQSPVQSPPARRSGATVFDAASNRIYIYGGMTSSPGQSTEEMWAFNGQWTQLNPTGATPRWGHQMVRRDTNNGLITFGGRSPTITSLANDTLEWSGSSWQTIATTNAPSPRFLYGMAYDSARDRVVLFGGRDGFAPNNETWEFDGTDWTQIVTPDAPAPREEMGMVYDAGLSRVVLYGGCDESTQTIYGDTWWYNGSNWVDVSPPNSPTPRFRGGMVFDSTRGRVVYYGGFDGTSLLAETLEYSGGDWTTTATTGPSNATEVYAAYNPVTQKTVVYGGFGGSFSNQTWQYTGDTNGVFSLYGAPCDTAAGTPGLTGTTPNIGTTVTVQATNLGTSAGVIWVVGLSDQEYNGLALPFDLGLLSLPGCGLLASPENLTLQLAQAGVAGTSTAIPSLLSLIGTSIYFQALIFDLTPALAYQGATQGGRALIGQ
jgi:hypothetical protein